MIQGDLGTTGIPDQMSIMQSNNLYNYTINNPVNFTDPLGLCVEEIDLEVSGNHLNNSEFIMGMSQDGPPTSIHDPRFIIGMSNNWLMDYMGSPTTIVGFVEGVGTTATDVALRLRLAKLTNLIIDPRSSSPVIAGLNQSFNRSVGQDIVRTYSSIARVQNIARFLPAAMIGIDVGLGIYENIITEAPTERIVSDAIADTAIASGIVWTSSLANMWAAGVVGVQIGGAKGKWCYVKKKYKLN